MLRDYVRSTAWVCRSGYEWRDGFEDTVAYELAKKDSPEAQRALVIIHDDIDTSPDGFECDPFNLYPSLFLEFAQLDGSEDSIREFVSRVGDYVFVSGARASLLDWRELIAEMQLGVQLWRAIEERNKEWLGQQFQWRGATLHSDLQCLQRLSRPPFKDFKSVIPSLVGRHGETYPKGELIRPATDLLDFLISKCAFDFILKPTRDKAGRLTFEVVLSYLPQIMWAQLAFHAAESNPCRACQECGQLFSLLDNRGDRAFCSDACRVKAYRVRRKRAESMRNEGKSLRDIVKELDSDLETVKKWLQPKGETDAKKKKGTRRR